MTPETRYADGPEGQIAYQVLGEGPRDLVYLSGATSHVDVRWESPHFSRFLERLASFSRLIVFDRRGTGASDPVSLDVLPTWEDWSDDLRVVMDAAGSDRAAVFGVLDAGPMATLFAATNPDRTTALILGNTTARWAAAEGYPAGASAEDTAALLRLVEQRWGTEEFGMAASPSLAGDPRALAWYAKYMRASASPRVATAQLRSALSLDLRAVLPSIRVPTLILQRRDYPFGGLEQGRYLAEHIPAAVFMELEGADSAMAFGDPEPVLDAAEEFLTGVKRQPDSDRVLATVLFTDLVDSTGRAVELGDRRWRALLDRHDELVRGEVEASRGRVWKTTGDGVLATFDAPGRAIRCAVTIRSALESLGLVSRAGLHTGEIEIRGDDVGGIGVHIASRVSALARPGEVLVSRTVSDLVVGSDIRFAERGTESLKGIPGEWQLYDVAD